MIAIALAGQPDLLIADEPTTSLDVTIQAQILTLLKNIQQKTGMALWLISHDLALVSTLADRVAVMQNGKIIETGLTKTIFKTPNTLIPKSCLKLCLQCKTAYFIHNRNNHPYYRLRTSIVITQSEKVFLNVSLIIFMR